jgi:hypothetical protein
METPRLPQQPLRVAELLSHPGEVTRSGGRSVVAQGVVDFNSLNAVIRKLRTLSETRRRRA